MSLPLPLATTFSVETPSVSPNTSTFNLLSPPTQDLLSIRLRNATQNAHQDVLQPSIVSQLVSGRLAPQHHLHYLMILYSLYSSLELALEKNSTSPILNPISDPTLLSRSEALFSDIGYYTGDPFWSTSSPPSHVWEKVKTLATPTSAIESYRNRLKELGESEDENYLLLAHSYVRYLGDLSGGQSIVRTIRKAYSLPPSGEGSSFYEFLLPPSSPYLPLSTTTSTTSIPAGPTEVKEIKSWFRNGLDLAGNQLSEDQKLKVLEEAKRAFGFNIGIFVEFESVVESDLVEERVGKVDNTTAAGGKGKVGVFVQPQSSKFTIAAVVVAFALAGWIAVRHYWDLEHRLWV